MFQVSLVADSPSETDRQRGSQEPLAIGGGSTAYVGKVRLVSTPRCFQFNPMRMCVEKLKLYALFDEPNRVMQHRGSISKTFDAAVQGFSGGSIGSGHSFAATLGSCLELGLQTKARTSKKTPFCVQTLGFRSRRGWARLNPKG